MAGSHKDYKAQKKAQAAQDGLNKQRRYSLSGTTKEERKSVKLTPAEEFTALFVGVEANTNFVYKKIRKVPIAAYAIALVVTIFAPSAFFGVLIAALIVHAVTLMFFPSLPQTRDAMKEIVLASQMPNPEYDRRGRRLRDRPNYGHSPQRSTEEILNSWDTDRRYGLEPGRDY